MPLYATLIENFFGNECTPERLDLILAALTAEDPPAQQTFEGNIFYADVDFDNGIVLLENDCDTTEYAKQRLSIEEFRKALIEWQRNGSLGNDPK
jgi:hypothetical protein